MNNSDINVIQSCIDYVFKNPKLLIAAFTHSSYVNEHEVVGNERIEFLGDCVLNFLVGGRKFDGFGKTKRLAHATAAKRALETLSPENSK